MASIAAYAGQFKRRLTISGPSVALIDARLIRDVCRSVGYRGRRRFWTPTLTALTLLRQILHGNCSCRQAVAMTLSQSAARAGQNWVSGDPSAYVQARARLPLRWFAELHRRVADSVRQRVADAARWCGRRVYIVDGSTLSMADTPALQGAFHQPPRQKPGCGFPQARLTAIFCHASGAVLDLAADSHRVSETTLLRRLLHRFQPGDVILADRGFHGYAGMVGFVRHGLDVVLRLNEAAWPDIRPVRRLSNDDQIAIWHRPRVRPRRLPRREWEQIPETMTVRLVRFRVNTSGIRSRRFELVTTLLDERAFPADELARLYRDRWLAELNLRSLKTTLGMDILKGQTPDIVYKEVFMYAVAYNLIRGLMWHAAATFEQDHRRLSFAGTQQRILATLPYLNSSHSSSKNHRIVARLLESIVADKLPLRPGRVEPRAVKRRKKSYVLLSIPRKLYRHRLLKTHAA